MLGSHLLQRVAFAVSITLASWLPGKAGAEERVLVATALQPTFSIASALAEDTGIEVVSVAAQVGMAGLPRTFARLDPAAAKNLENADAVITMRSVWPGDPLFTEARARNIRVVEIDAATSLAKSGARVALLEQPGSDAPWRQNAKSSDTSPYVWFSPSNGVRIAEIVAADLQRLSPPDAERITANLGTLVKTLTTLKAEYEAKFLSLPDPSLYALTDRFAYLTNDFGLFVDGYFVEQDVRWTEADFAGFSALLADREISHVLHHWEPAEPILAAAAKAGAKIVILDDGEAGPNNKEPMQPDGYETMLRGDLEALYQALAK